MTARRPLAARTLSPMLGLILMLAMVAALGLLLWWAVGLPPTRPRPDSRYRGRTYMSVHRRLRRPGDRR